MMSTTNADWWLVDTGVLVRLFNSTDPDRPMIRSAVQILLRRSNALFTTPQNIAEFWNVSTRPHAARGGFGLTLEQTQRVLRSIERLVTVLEEPHRTYDRWKELVIRHAVTGTSVHDARLVAVMSIVGVSQILTTNAHDFQRYPGLTIVTPKQLVAAPADPV